MRLDVAAGAFTGLGGRIEDGFSGEVLNGERGRVRELCDLGDRTVVGLAFLEAVRDVLSVVVPVVDAAVFARFFGFARLLWPS